MGVVKWGTTELTVRPSVPFRLFFSLARKLLQDWNRDQGEGEEMCNNCVALILLCTSFSCGCLGRGERVNCLTDVRAIVHTVYKDPGSVVVRLFQFVSSVYSSITTW